MPEFFPPPRDIPISLRLRLVLTFFLFALALLCLLTDPPEGWTFLQDVSPLPAALWLGNGIFCLFLSSLLLTKLARESLSFRAFMPRPCPPTVAAGDLSIAGAGTGPADSSTPVPFHFILDALPIPVFYKDENGVYLGCNRRFEEFLEQPREKIIGSTVFDVAPPELAQVYFDADRELLERGGTQTYESAVIGGGGIRHEVIFHKQVFHRPDGSPGGLIGAMIDISARKEAEAAALYLSQFDPLTRLPNQVLFTDRLMQVMAQSRRTNQRFAVISLDIDHFKKINLAFGYAKGDELLKRFSRRLSGAVRSDDTVAKLGGDSFQLLLPGIQQGENVLGIAQKVQEFLQRPFRVDDQEIALTASLGVAIFPEDGEDPCTLLKNAGSALQEAKSKGRNTVCFYTPAMNSRAGEQLTLVNQLRKGLEKGEFTLYYQPQIDAASGAVVGAEALLRWQHPVRGLLLPGDFIPLAEESDLILALGDWVLRTACCQAMAWQHQGLPPLRVSVNISARQLRSRALIQQVEDALAASGLPPHLLSLELTESCLMENLDLAVEVLTKLKGSGIHLAIDDFGTGYSSLTYLKRFPLNMVKIDRSFIMDIPAPDDDRAIVGAIIAMAHSLGLTVLTEGVQQQEQAEILRQQGCDEFQGYLFGRPLPADELETILRRHPAPAAVTAGV